ncbi:hypothetical protein Q787_00055 [Ornithobacterium rhinotracheale H06-030791]|nr:hypothetical protein Q785_00055 [Ornithobacterium rhinotracheale ORT-UMN 88]KGB67924.1 hypothetical protein Q787_00055 [Ornithobacterium rhinotracheale H06-030791]
MNQVQGKHHVKNRNLIYFIIPNSFRNPKLFALIVILNLFQNLCDLLSKTLNQIQGDTTQKNGI